MLEALENVTVMVVGELLPFTAYALEPVASFPCGASTPIVYMLAPSVTLASVIVVDCQKIPHAMVSPEATGLPKTQVIVSVISQPASCEHDCTKPAAALAT